MYASMNDQSIRIGFKVSSTALRICLLVGTEWLLMDTFLDFEGPRLFILFSTESPTTTTPLHLPFLSS